jgi:ATP/maltotriose-dependent transcriptional regulator MalT
VRAAELAHVAGQRDKAVELAWLAEREVEEAALRARAVIVRAEIATWAGDVRPAYELWMEATERFASVGDPSTGYPLFRAVETAWMGADFSRAEVAAERAERLGIDHAPWVRSLAVAAAGLNRSCSYGAADAVEAARRLIEIHSEFHDRLDLIDQIILAKLTFFGGDLFGAESEAAELVSRCRKFGASGPLVWALAVLAYAQVHTGRFADAESSATAAVELAEELRHLSVLHVVLSRALAPVAALRGDSERCEALVARAVEVAPKSTEVRPDFALALLDAAHGRFEAALDRMLRIAASEAPMELLPHMPTIVEAAVRCGRADEIAGLFTWFAEWAEAAGVAHWLALLERCRGLLATEVEAGAHFERAAELHLESAASPFEAARTDLAYGGWLRRTRRVAEGRSRLRAAAEAFERLGAEPWVERTRAELRAAGDSGEVAAEPGLAERLTPQELQVVRLAAAGLSNREIGEQLYVSPRTAGYHLYKAYPKLGVASRTELARLKL